MMSGIRCSLGGGGPRGALIDNLSVEGEEKENENYRHDGLKFDEKMLRTVRVPFPRNDTFSQQWFTHLSLFTTSGNSKSHTCCVHVYCVIFQSCKQTDTVVECMVVNQEIKR